MCSLSRKIKLTMFSISFIKNIMFKVQSITKEKPKIRYIIHTKLFFQGHDVELFSFENFSSVYCVLLKNMSSLVGNLWRISIKYQGLFCHMVIYFHLTLQIISSMVICIVSAVVTSLIIVSAVFGLHFDTFASYYFRYNKEVLSYVTYL